MESRVYGLQGLILLQETFIAEPRLYAYLITMTVPIRISGPESP